jgi:hypothetical protein
MPGRRDENLAKGCRTIAMAERRISHDLLTHIFAIGSVLPALHLGRPWGRHQR